MSFYSDRILPHLINLSMRNRELLPYRERVIPQAHGRVLEIGIGSGLNLPFYGSRVDELVGLEPAAGLIAMAQRSVGRFKVPVRLIAGSAEAVPLDANSIDTLREMRRVLRANGQLLFLEHGLAPEDNIQKWQNRLTPLWKRIGGGCHLNRPIRTLIESAGFGIARLETGYVKGPNPITFFYEGRANPT
jgi:ubiquinone/menaquinone biosynthesis C-methylase UbiE